MFFPFESISFKPIHQQTAAETRMNARFPALEGQVYIVWKEQKPERKKEKGWKKKKEGMRGDTYLLI